MFSVASAAIQEMTSRPLGCKAPPLPRQMSCAANAANMETHHWQLDWYQSYRRCHASCPKHTATQHCTEQARKHRSLTSFCSSDGKPATSSYLLLALASVWMPFCSQALVGHPAQELAPHWRSCGASDEDSGSWQNWAEHQPRHPERPPHRQYRPLQPRRPLQPAAPVSHSRHHGRTPPAPPALA